MCLCRTCDTQIGTNFPSSSPQDPEEGPNPTEDNAEFVRISEAYSLIHPKMNDTAFHCPQWGHMENGITNGAEWYPVQGGMQDFNYMFSGTMEVTVEVSCCKFAHKSRLLEEWILNRESITSFVEQVHRGVKGFVVDPRGRPVPGAEIRVRGKNDQDWRRGLVPSDQNGAFWRILVEGKYLVQAVRGRRKSRVEEVVVQKLGRGKAERIELVIV